MNEGVEEEQLPSNLQEPVSCKHLFLHLESSQGLLLR